MSDVEDWPHFGMAGSVTCMHDWVSRACTCMHDWGVASLGCGGCAGPGFWQHAMHNALQRNGELRQLEADLGDLHTLFKDVATLAQLQQEHLDTIEGAVMETGMRVVAGTNELQKAHRTQKKARRRMCCMLVTGSVAISLGMCLCPHLVRCPLSVSLSPSR
eukprot:Tamp_08603.p3 GENE.Tamp_08603~~Tamp_08603.p3  ORF type:complete len:161 (+),score=31.05 Tamp_08603:1465-1947(+)